ncbi:hypothetical protein Tco_1250880, partial [Tanacetum coccineum]
YFDPDEPLPSLRTNSSEDEEDDRQEEEPDTSPLDSTQSQQAWVNLIQWDPMMAMETRNSTELNKILDTIEADKRDMAQQMKAMQDKIQELLNSQNHGEDSNSHGSVIKEGSSGLRSNDNKVNIPEYDGKLDPDEFVEWIRTVERVFDYKETTDDNKVKIVA